ncbi:TolC family protein, partial [Deinococcus sp. A31D244]|uniref:TolC family protein n=1 Tax=Deinococcus sp. A31D244 TaxID=3397675 RepID=UPI0039E1577F
MNLPPAHPFRRGLPLALALSAALALASGPALAQATPAAPPTQPATTPATTQAPAPQPTATQTYTLEQAYAQLAGAPSVTRAALSVQVAQQNLEAARSALGLTVSVNGNASYVGSGASTASDGTATTTAASLGGNAGVSVSLGLLPWSNNQSSLRASERSLALARATLQEAQRSARLNVTQAYFDAVLATQDLQISAQTTALRTRQLQVAQAQDAAGNAAPEAVLSAQAALQAAQSAAAQAQGTLDTAQRTLESALGVSLGRVTFSPPAQATLTLPDVSALVARARTGRADVITAQNTLAAAQDTLDTAQRDATLPDLTASVGYGGGSAGTLSTSLNLKQGTLSSAYSVPVGSSTSGSASGRLTASLSGSYVVYSPAQKASLSADQASVTQAALSLTVAQQNVELDVRSRFIAAQHALTTVQTRQTQVQVAQQQLATAQARVQAGTATPDDVQSAELTLAQAQRDLLSARLSAQTTL